MSRKSECYSNKGFINNPTKEASKKILYFRSRGIDFVRVANLALKILMEDVILPGKFREHYFIASDTEKSNTWAGLWQTSWVKALGILYPEFEFDFGGKTQFDIISKVDSTLNHEIKSSVSLGIYFDYNLNKHVFRFHNYYEPAVSSNMSEDNSKNNFVKKKAKDNVIIHTKIHQPELLDCTDFNVVFVQGLYIKPGDIGKSGGSGYIYADVLQHQSIMLYEDYTYLETIKNKVKDMNIQQGIDPRTRSEIANEKYSKMFEDIKGKVPAEQKPVIKSAKNEPAYGYSGQDLNNLYLWLKKHNRLDEIERVKRPTTYNMHKLTKQYNNTTLSNKDEATIKFMCKTYNLVSVDELNAKGYNCQFDSNGHLKPATKQKCSDNDSYWRTKFYQLIEDIETKCHHKISLTSSFRLRSFILINYLPKPKRKSAKKNTYDEVA